MPYKIEVTDECIKCGLCASVCDNFELKDDKAHPKKAQVDEAGCNKDAAEQCPAKCIHVTEA